MEFETLKEIMRRHGVEIVESDMQLLILLSHFPTSELLELFNEIAVEDVFTIRKDKLF